MAYHISYTAVGPKKSGFFRKNKKQIVFYGVLFLLGLFAVVGYLWQPFLQEVFLPGDGAVTAAALEKLADMLGQGKTVAESVTAFCKEVITYGR